MDSGVLCKFGIVIFLVLKFVIFKEFLNDNYVILFIILKYFGSFKDVLLIRRYWLESIDLIEKSEFVFISLRR